MTFRNRTVPCGTCNDGRVEGFRRFAGEAVAGEPVDECCPDCDGTGEVDQPCVDCGRYEPLDDELFCQRCVDGVTLTIAEFDAKYGLTETRGDPFRRRAA